MSSNANPVVLNSPEMNVELEKAIKAATSPEAIQAAVLAEATRQSDAAAATAQAAADEKKKADDAAAAKAAEEAKTAEMVGFTRTEVIGGREFIFEAPTELELERQVSNALRIANGLQTVEAPVEQPAEVVDPAAVQKAAEQKAAAMAELELKFKRGEISTKEYIKQSGAMAEYLADEGVSLQDLKASVESQKANTEVQSWSDAVQEFLRGPYGEDWPGGDKNRELLGDKIASMGLMDEQDKVAALGRAWSKMKETGAYFPYQKETPVATSNTIAIPATSVVTAAPVVAAPAALATPVTKTATSSSLFDRSSGVLSMPTKPVDAVAPIEIPPNATPEEMLAYWKQSQVAAGKNPDDAFRETFGARR